MPRSFEVSDLRPPQNRPRKPAFLHASQSENPALREMIYFIQSGKWYRDPIKIGFAADPAARLCDLQVGNPAELTLLAIDEHGDKATEAKYHAMFAKSHIRGEWFKATDGLLNLIDRLNAR